MTAAGEAGEPRRVLRGVADGSLLVEYPDASDEEANAAAVRLARSLDAGSPEGLLDLVPGARTLFLAFDPLRLGPEELARRIESAGATDSAPDNAREHRIAIAYGGAAGPDLEEVSRRAGLTPEEAARRHAAAVYRVAFLGFAPGFAYLTGLPPELSAPRRSTPRPRVRGGTLAIADRYSGIYPEDGPGGWNLIGETDAILIDPLRDPPALLAPGDVVRFEARPHLGPESVGDSVRPHPDPLPGGEGEALFRVISPGLWSVVCGGPRARGGRFGAPPGGAMDLEALAAGNASVGNAPGAPALEMTLAGPELDVLGECDVVLAGSPCDARVNGSAWPRGGDPRVLRRGDRLALGPLRAGARSYLCVAGGGLSPRETLGAPRRLAAGDVLFRDTNHPPARRSALSLPVRRLSSEGVVRIVLGPQQDLFTQQGIATLLQSEYRVSSTSDRRGVRLEGPPVAHRSGAEIPPEGTALGAIQVPGDGLPIVLGADRPVTGGYAKIGTVIGADFPAIAQGRPGSTLRFRAVSIEEALQARRRMGVP